MHYNCRWKIIFLPAISLNVNSITINYLKRLEHDISKAQKKFFTVNKDSLNTVWHETAHSIFNIPKNIPSPPYWLQYS
jgi:hypothetical protein